MVYLSKKEKQFIVSQFNSMGYDEVESYPKEWQDLRESIVYKLSKRKAKF